MSVDLSIRNCIQSISELTCDPSTAHGPRPVEGGRVQREAHARLSPLPPTAGAQHDRRPLAARRRHRRLQRPPPAQQVHVDEDTGTLQSGSECTKTCQIISIELQCNVTYDAASMKER